MNRTSMKMVPRRWAKAVLGVWRAGALIWLTPAHLGTCSLNEVTGWEKPKLTLWQRMIALQQPTGCPPWELAFITMCPGSWWLTFTGARLNWRAPFASAVPQSTVAERES